MGGLKDVFNFISNVMHLVDTLSYVIIRYFLSEDSPLKTYNVSKKKLENHDDPAHAHEYFFYIVPKISCALSIPQSSTKGHTPYIL